MSGYKAIMACDLSGGIGMQGTLPWPHSKEDFKHFKKITSGQVVVMGSNTWHDPKFPKPLPNRCNVVLSSKTFDGPHYIFSDNYLEKINKIRNDREVFFIGGATVIQQNLENITELYLTIFQQNYTCDKRIDLVYFKSWTWLPITKTEELHIYRIVRD